MSRQLAELLEHVDAIGRIRELEYELRCLQAWKLQAAKQIGFGDGDRVAIRPTWTPKRDGGWAPYYECMAPGQVGTVRELVINPETLSVSALTVWDTEWSTYIAHWKGAETERTLHENPHIFCFPVKHLRRANDDDRALSMPSPVSSKEQQA